MHYGVKYNGDEAEALVDAKEWLGEDRWQFLCEYAKDHSNVTLDQLKLVMSFAGIQGFPVFAIHKHLWPDVPHVETDSE